MVESIHLKEALFPFDEKNFFFESQKKMKISSYVEKYENDEDDDDTYYIISLEAKEGEDTLFHFRPEYSGTVEEWKEMILACEEEDRQFYFTHGGDCQIGVCGKFVTFELSRHGDGYGGESSIQIPKKLCIDAFKNIYVSIGV